jgi:hypothetical protein
LERYLDKGMGKYQEDVSRDTQDETQKGKENYMFGPIYTISLARL